MVVDAVSQWVWVLWVALILVFVIIEIFSLQFVFLMIAIGSCGGLVSGLAGAPFWVQIVVTAVLSLLLVFLLRPPLLHALKRGADPTLSNVDALMGLKGRVVSPVTSAGGQVKLANGELWTARQSSSNERHVLHVDESVTVTAIDGATAVVEPEERNANHG